MSSIQVVNSRPTERVRRNPQHTYRIQAKPFAIVPFMIAPVLPGETMKNLLHQSSTWTRELAGDFTGAWLETYYFYVKHRDLDAREDFTEMMLNPEKNLSAFKLAAANVDFYQHKGALNWMQLAYQRIVDQYFRDEDESWNTAMIGNYAAAKLNGESWMDSLIKETDFAINDEKVDVDNDGIIYASEVDEAMRNWQFMRANKLTDMTYEDFLRTYGVRTSRIELHRPELIRYSRDWAVSSTSFDAYAQRTGKAIRWETQERADKDRFFPEPGFVIGLQVVRFKRFFGKLTGAAAGLMDDALAWLPAIMRDDPYSSMKLIKPAAHPIITGVTADYYVDLKDLFIYGDQFTNMAVNPAAMASLPGTNLERKYATLAEANLLFAPSVVDADKFIYTDGVTTMNILGTLIDQT